MADLPDIDTTTVGFIAYWNAKTQGGLSSLDPSEVLSHTRVQSYTLYDNGVEGTFTTTVNREVTFRVKDDGWFVAYMDRRNEYVTATTTRSDVEGYWDIAHQWTYTAGNAREGDITSNTLEMAIAGLKNELSNSSGVTYSTADVGLYNYEYSTSTTATLLSKLASSPTNVGLAYTSGTTINYWSMAGATDNYAYVTNIRFEGYDLTLDSNQFGACDVLYQNLCPNAETEYTGYVDGYDGNDLGHLVSLSLWE